MGAGEQAQHRRSAFPWPWLLLLQPGAGMGGSRSILKASTAERLLFPMAWLGVRQGENSGQVPCEMWNGLTKRGCLECAPGGFHMLVAGRWKSLFSTRKSRAKQESGRKLFSLHGPCICAPSAQIILVFTSKFVILQREVRRRDLTLLWLPSSPSFAGSGAARPASPSA